jgi:hypothetical protein
MAGEANGKTSCPLVCALRSELVSANHVRSPELLAKVHYTLQLSTCPARLQDRCEGVLINRLKPLRERYNSQTRSNASVNDTLYMDGRQAPGVAMDLLALALQGSASRLSRQDC